MKPAIAFLLCIFAIGIARADELDGRTLFLKHCAACHGATGEGDGPVAAAMVITVPNLRTLAKRAQGDYPADAVASYIDGRATRAAHGTREMPVWGWFFESGADWAAIAAGRARVAALVEFIRQLQYP